jgi:hypothetical protein
VRRASCPHRCRPRPTLRGSAVHRVAIASPAGNVDRPPDAWASGCFRRRASRVESRHSGRHGRSVPPVRRCRVLADDQLPMGAVHPRRGVCAQGHLLPLGLDVPVPAWEGRSPDAASPLVGWADSHSTGHDPASSRVSCHAVRAACRAPPDSGRDLGETANHPRRNRRVDRRPHWRQPLEATTWPSYRTLVYDGL